MEKEVVGLDMLRQIAKELYGNEDPTRIFYRGKAQTFEKDSGQYVLSFDFPYSSKEEISVIKNGDEFIIQVGSYRRNIILPLAIVNLPVNKAKFEKGKLMVRFGDANQPKKKPGKPGGRSNNA